jgi:hypothetical protein
MRYSIEVRSAIQALMSEAVVRDENGAMLAGFRVDPAGDDWTVVDHTGATVSRHERWDHAAERTVLLASEHVIRLMRGVAVH